MFGSVAIAALAAGGTFGALALKKRSDLDAQKCKPICSDTAIAPVKNFALYADISFGIAAVSAGIATIIYLNRPVVPLKDDKLPPATGPKPEAYIAPGFLGAGLGGSF